ncbi:MAG TPA: ribonuclease III [Ktedonobacterales bacterium]
MVKNPERGPELEALERRLGHTFKQRERLVEALTHRSFAAEAGDPRMKMNERLEFLGDAVMALLTADLLFKRYPKANEGALSIYRAALVRTQSFAEFARELDLGAHLRLGHGEELTGGRERPATLEGAFEAIIGALYLDGGFAAASAVALPLLGAKLGEIEAAGLEENMVDAKSRLQMLAQGRLGQTPRYHTIEESGPAHARQFVVEVRLGDIALARGEGASKREAQQAAALAALADPGWSESPRDL